MQVQFHQLFEQIDKRRLFTGTSLLVASYFFPFANPAMRLIAAGTGLSFASVSLNRVHGVLSPSASRSLAIVQKTLFVAAFGLVGAGHLRIAFSSPGQHTPRVMVLNG